jgi:L-fucose mutarotase
MLKYKLLHPEILSALGGAGHGSKILIADGNYPFATRAHPNARRVYLNLAPGMVPVTDVLRVLVNAIPIEAAHVMLTDSGEAPPIHEEFRTILPPGLELQPLNRQAFYDAVRLDPDTALVIATGEQRIFANIILTIGVVPPPV